jgi:hypothetical protein
MHYVWDFVQILYFAGGVHIINENNVFHSFLRPGTYLFANGIFRQYAN